MYMAMPSMSPLPPSLLAGLQLALLTAPAWRLVLDAVKVALLWLAKLRA